MDVGPAVEVGVVIVVAMIMAAGSRYCADNGSR